ncbi:MAG TPA: hypothetical protein VIY47_05535 [Ignavibacteriaceae bacterium]
MDFTEGTQIFVFRSIEAANSALSTFERVSFGTMLHSSIFIVFDAEKMEFDFSVLNAEFDSPRRKMNISSIFPLISIPKDCVVSADFYQNFDKNQKMDAFNKLLSLPIVHVHEEYETMALFLEFARSVQPDFSLNNMSSLKVQKKNGVEVFSEDMVNCLLRPCSDAGSASWIENWTFKFKLDWNLKKVIEKSNKKEIWESLGVETDSLDFRGFLYLIWVELQGEVDPITEDLVDFPSIGGVSTINSDSKLLSRLMKSGFIGMEDCSLGSNIHKSIKITAMGNVVLKDLMGDNLSKIFDVLLAGNGEGKSKDQLNQLYSEIFDSMHQRNNKKQVLQKADFLDISDFSPGD